MWHSWPASLSLLAENLGTIGLLTPSVSKLSGDVVMARAGEFPVKNRQPLLSRKVGNRESTRDRGRVARFTCGSTERQK